jgi:hypothetical protein
MSELEPSVDGKAEEYSKMEARCMSSVKVSQQSKRAETHDALTPGVAVTTSTRAFPSSRNARTSADRSNPIKSYPTNKAKDDKFVANRKTIRLAPNSNVQ